MGALLLARNRLVRLIGVPVATRSVFDTVARTDHQVVVGVDDVHLDFRAGVTDLAGEDTPLVGTRLTLGLLDSKLREHRMNPSLEYVREGDKRTYGPFECEFVAVNHSIPDALAVAVTTGSGLAATSVTSGPRWHATAPSVNGNTQNSLTVRDTMAPSWVTRTVDRCRRVIDAEQELRYVVRMEIEAVLDPIHEGEPQDDRDHLLEIDEILERVDASESDCATPES